MRFYLFYHGPLPPSGNKPKPDAVKTIRDQFDPQMKFLWDTNAALKRLRQTAIVSKGPVDIALTETPFGVERNLHLHPLREHEIDLCGPIIEAGRKYVPLVRTSLNVNCHLNIQFLRQEDPGSLVLQGGDLDNRIKTLFDALKKPEPNGAICELGKEDPVYCLLESDTLISGFEVDTGRLLLPQTGHANEAVLLIEVIIKVLSVGPWNMSLIGM